MCAAGCGLCVSETVLRVRNIEHPWRCPEVVEVLRKVPGVLDAVWDRSTECVVVAYLPSRRAAAPVAGIPVR